MTLRQDDIDCPFVLENELRRPDSRAIGQIEKPALSEFSFPKVAASAAAIVIALGALIYGLTGSGERSSVASDHAPGQTTQQASSPAVPPDVRDVTPRNNTEPGMTTGAAPAKTLPSAR